MTGGAGIVIICFLLIMATLQLLVTLILALTLSFPFPTSADNIASFFMLMWEAKQRSLTRLHPIQPESHLDVHLYIEVVSSENWIFDNILYGDEFICFSKSSEKLICYSWWKVKLVLAYFTYFYIYQTNSINQTISISIYCEMIILKLMLQICKFWLES